MTRSFRSKRTPGDTGVFGLMGAAKVEAMQRGQQVVDLSVGIPDMLPPPEAIDALRAAVDDPETYKYHLRHGTAPLLEAAVAWYQRHYGAAAALDPAKEALCLVGSQEGLAHLLLAVADPGDGLLMCDVGYACYLPAAQIAGLTPHFLPLRRDGSFLPDFAAVPPEAASASRVLLLNYPNNPTSAVADDAFWAEALAFCEKHDLLLVNDNPYVAQVYDGSGLASSPLALPGAKARTVELFSFAKSYQIGGVRLGFALGNADAIAALEAVKAPIDFNQYLGIQRMGVVCLQLPQERLRVYAREFAARAAAVTDALREHAGWDCPMPRACMYVWAKLPEGYSDDTAFCLALVAATGVAISPGSGFGPGGRGYVRFALVQPEGVLRDAARKVGEFLASPAAAALRAPPAAGAAAAVAAGKAAAAEGQAGGGARGAVALVAASH